MTIGKICPASYSIDNSLLPNVFCYKDFGVSFDNSLSFDSHISIICSKCYNIINQLFRIFRIKNIHALILAFKSYCRPILEYCSSIWSHNKHSKHYLNIVDRLEKVQRYFTRKLLFLIYGYISHSSINYKAYDNRSDLFKLESLELKTKIWSFYYFHANLQLDQMVSSWSTLLSQM